MKQVLVRYKVKPEAIEENLELIAPVMAELESVDPQGFRYAAFQLDDPTEFVHIALYDEGVESPLPGIDAFQRYTAGIADRCVEQPEVLNLHAVESFKMYS
jgi:hypothetical protein